MSTIRITWPDRALHPNGRAHWSKKAKAGKIAKNGAFYLAKEAGLSASPEGPIPVHMTFYPRTRHAVDEDGCIASMKWALDGIALAMKVDDSRFRLTMDIAEKPGGYVDVTVGASG